MSETQSAVGPRIRVVANLVIAFVILGGGGIGFYWLLKTKPAPRIQSSFARVLEVAAEPVVARDVSIPVVGHGTVRPKRQVNIVPQVSGQLVASHADLAQGKIIAKDEVLFEIDPTVYEARVRQAQAEVRGLEASLERLDQEMTNLDARIANAEQMVAIDERDYQTSKELYEVEKVGTQRDLDLILQKSLRSKDALVELNSRRAIIPHLKVETEAQLDAARARLTHANHDFAGTTIRCPFRARVEGVSAYHSQVVTAHFAIATLTDLGAFEMSVGLDPREIRWLDWDIRPESLEQRNGDAPDGPAVYVRWVLPHQEFTWRGFATRFERVDEVTRTTRVVVEVRDVDMVAAAAPGQDDHQPTLSIGMYCRAEFPAEPLADALVVPRHAVFDDRWVYVFEPDGGDPESRTGRLGRREIVVLRAVQDQVLVDYRGHDGPLVSELRSGERVVLSPLVKPVVGMKIALQASSGASTLTASLRPVPWIPRVVDARGSRERHVPLSDAIR